MKTSTVRISKFLGVTILVALCGLAPARATPLDTGSWMQVGNVSTGSDVFNGNCNLSSSCDYALDGDGDFWSRFDTFAGQQILFVTGNRQIWAAASDQAVHDIVSAAAGVFTPNITWSDAGLGGVSLGSSVTGNILHRSSANEDPWVTLRGGHCAHLTGNQFPIANDCNLIIWGESNNTAVVHNSLKNASGGVEVYVTALVPEPSTLAIPVVGLAGLGLRRRKG